MKQNKASLILYAITVCVLVQASLSSITSAQHTYNRYSQTASVSLHDSVIQNNSNDGPIIEWSKSYGYPHHFENGKSVELTTDGGYVALGFSSENYFLVKTDASGVEQWNKTYDGLGSDYPDAVQQTSDGGYILSGITFGGPAGTAFWVVKTDSDGNEQWNKTYHGDECYSVRQTNDGGFILAGVISYNTTNQFVLLIKTDNAGNEQWNRTFGQPWNGCYCYSVQQTIDEGFILVGGTSCYGAGSVDVWLIKTNENGIEQWNRTFGYGCFDMGYSVQQTSDHGYIITGYVENAPSGFEDVWLIKTDDTGMEQWNKTFGNPFLTDDDRGYYGQQTADGGYIIIGANNYGFDPRAWLIKTDSIGNEQWDFFLEYNGVSLRQTTDGGYIVVGTGGSDNTGHIRLTKLRSITGPQLEINTITGGRDIAVSMKDSGDLPLKTIWWSLAFTNASILYPFYGSLTGYIPILNASNSTTIVTPVFGFAGLFRQSKCTITFEAQFIPTVKITIPVKVFLFKVTIQH